MPKYRYRAVDHLGRRKSGTIEAASFGQASEQLKGQGLWIADLSDLQSSLWHRDVKDFLGGPRVKTQHFTVFCRQLSTMYKSGISLVDSVRILAMQTSSKPFKSVLRDIAEEMNAGTQLSVAAAAYPTVFNNIFIQMVRAGEASGNLDEMLDRLAIFYEKEHGTREKLKSAMAYPIILSFVMVFVVLFLMIFVIPRFVDNFQNMGLALPLATRIVVGVSTLLKKLWFVVIGLLIFPFLLWKISGQSEEGRLRNDTWKLRVPVFGRLWHKQALARFARTFGTLYSAAIPMLEALTIVSQVVDNRRIGQVIADSRENISNGQSMAEPFQRSPLFPPMIAQMLATGEQTGALDTMLDKMADFYDAEVDTMTDRLKSLIEPILILTIAVVVGGIVLAILMPTFQMMDSVPN